MVNYMLPLDWRYGVPLAPLGSSRRIWGLQIFEDLVVDDVRVTLGPTCGLEWLEWGGPWSCINRFTGGS